MIPTKKLQVCCICLCTDRRLHNINRHNLQDDYTTIFGPLLSDLIVHQKICWECGARLIRAAEFRKNAIQAYNILKNVFEHEKYDMIKINEDRVKHNLTSKLQTKVYKANHVDYTYKYKEPKNNQKKTLQSLIDPEINRSIDVKTETAIGHNTVDPNMVTVPEKTYSGDEYVDMLAEKLSTDPDIVLGSNSGELYSLAKPRPDHRNSDTKNINTPNAAHNVITDKQSIPRQNEEKTNLKAKESIFGLAARLNPYLDTVLDTSTDLDSCAAPKLVYSENIPNNINTSNSTHNITTDEYMSKLNREISSLKSKCYNKVKYENDAVNTVNQDKVSVPEEIAATSVSKEIKPRTISEGVTVKLENCKVRSITDVKLVVNHEIDGLTDPLANALVKAENAENRVVGEYVRCEEKHENTEMVGVMCNTKHYDDEVLKDDTQVEVKLEITKPCDDFDLDLETEDIVINNNSGDILFDTIGDSVGNIVNIAHKSVGDRIGIVDAVGVRRKKSRNSQGTFVNGTAKKRNTKKEPNNKDAYVFDCFDTKQLTLQDQLNELETSRSSLKYKRLPFKCEKCCRGFSNEDSYETHLMRHTDTAGLHECRVCKLRFTSPSRLRTHLNRHAQKFMCKLCPYVSTNKSAAKFHGKYHQGLKYRCPHCPQEYEKLTTYMSHMRLRHPSDIVCELCGYSFLNQKGLAQHKTFKHRHKDEKIPADGPICLECDIRFLNKKALEIHLKESARHTDPSTRRALVRKNLKKPQSNPIVSLNCEQCNLPMSSYKAYAWHFRREHPDKNRTRYPMRQYSCLCEVCGAMFSYPTMLEDHMTTHENAKQFECFECGKRFKRKMGLVAHMKLHNGVPRKLHPCGVCGKTFTSDGNMKRHTSIHTGVRPFNCEICGKSFRCKVDKKMHVTYVHMKKPWPKRDRRNRQKNKQETEISD